jgi:hypothetical protein
VQWESGSECLVEFNKLNKLGMEPYIEVWVMQNLNYVVDQGSVDIEFNRYRLCLHQTREERRNLMTPTDSD